jgi:5-methylcytosine-specific restriction endonuclease McrA
MKKADRQKIFDKYGGRCAYCGCELQKGWHVDHIDPVVRKTKTVYQHWKHIDTGEVLQQNEGLKRLRNMPDREKWEYVPTRHDIPDGIEYPERHTLSNMMPACPSCNINKHGDTIEGFRSSIKGYLNSLNLRMVQYKMAKKYNLVKETGIEVKFYFETLTTEGRKMNGKIQFSEIIPKV